MSIVSHAFKVLDELDLTVITDQRDEEGNPCFYAGWHQELAAGIRGGSASPFFDTQDELIDWINANEKKLRKECYQ